MKTLKQIGVFSFKGGVGKTSTAYLLAMAAHDAGETVTLVDFDPQHSIAVAASVNPPPFLVVRGNIESEELEIPPATTLVIADHPPGMNPEEITGVYDFLVIPFLPNALELHPLSYALKDFKEAKNLLLVANRYKEGERASEDKTIQSIKSAFTFPILPLAPSSDIPEAIAAARPVRKSTATENFAEISKFVLTHIRRK